MYIALIVKEKTKMKPGKILNYWPTIEVLNTNRHFTFMWEQTNKQTNQKTCNYEYNISNVYNLYISADKFEIKYWNCCVISFITNAYCLLYVNTFLWFSPLLWGEVLTEDL